MMGKEHKRDFADGKVRMDLLPWPELEEVAKVFTAGAKKYGERTWTELDNGYERYKGALLRHLCELEKGNDIDPDTGCLHCAQVAWNALAMLHFKMSEKHPAPLQQNEDAPLSCPSCHSTAGIYVRNADTGLVQCRNCLTAFYIKGHGEQESCQTKEKTE